MKHSLPGLLRSWIRAVRSHHVVRDGDPDAVAQANLLSFSLAEVQGQAVTADQLRDFLAQAADHFSHDPVARPRGMWFYAWVDEMAGSLRLSLCRAETEQDLPFRGPVEVVTDPDPVVALALGSEYSEGVPVEELEAAADAETYPDLGEVEDDWRDDDALRVFARPVHISRLRARV